MADPDLIARKDKHYLVDQREWGEGPLPAMLEKPGDETEVLVDIADDLESAASDDALKAVTLRLLVEQLTVLDELQVDLNGHTLSSQARTHQLYDTWLDDVSPPLLRQGWNRLRVRVIARTHQLYNDTWLEFDVSPPLWAGDGGCKSGNGGPAA